MKSKFYTINEICRLTSVTIRTLHYYDEIGLLKPSSRSLGGHRHYSEQDLIALQQIVTLKYMGFTLRQIKKSLQDKNFDLSYSLKIQADALEKEIAKIKKASEILNFSLNNLQINQMIDWRDTIKLIETLNDNNTNQWYEKYLNKEEIEIYKQISQKRTTEWLRLFKEIKKLKTAIPSKKTKKLIEKISMLINSAYQNNPELKAKLWEGYKSGMIPNFSPDEKVIAFLTKVAPLIW